MISRYAICDHGPVYSFLASFLAHLGTAKGLLRLTCRSLLQQLPKAPILHVNRGRSIAHSHNQYLPWCNQIRNKLMKLIMLLSWCFNCT